MPTTSHVGRRSGRQKTPTFIRHKNARPVTLTLDPEARHLLEEMATGKTLGAFLSGLVRAEWARIEERRRLRRLLDEERESMG